MKKLLILSLCLMGAIGLAGCDRSAEGDSAISEIPNPVVEYDSLYEINQKVGCDLVHPPVMGVSREKFSVIGDTLAEYSLEVNGVPYTFRARKTESDITGVYLPEGTLSDRLEDTEEGIAITAEGYHIARWFIDDMQYVLYCRDTEESSLFTLQVFAEEAMTLQGLTPPEIEYPE